LCTVHAVYNATLDKFYVALFLSNAIGDTNNYFAHIYSVALTVSDTVSFTVNNDKNMKGVNDLDTQYCSFQDNIAKTNFQQSGSTAYYCFWYFVTNSRIWLENYDRRTDGRTIQNCDIGLIPDDELGFKIQFSNPLYAPSILSYDFNISFRTYKLHNFGCLISTRATNTSNACGYCDYITYAVTFREGAAHFDTGAVLNKVILMNNEVVTGLTLPDTQRILVTDWNSVDEENIYLTNYSSRDSYDFKDDSVVIYKANNKFYKLVRTDKPKLRLVNNQIVINCDMLKNSYRITDGAKLLFAPSWNNRVLIDTATTRNTDLNVNTYYVATSINEYKLDNNASIILNPIPVINPINITVNRRNLNEELPSYSTYLANTPENAIAKDGSFTADVYMKSDEALSAGELNFACENGTITSAVAGDLSTGSADTNFEYTDNKLSFYGNTASATDGLKVATVTVQADGSGKDVVLSIVDGMAAKTGAITDTAVTLKEEDVTSVTVPIAKNDKVSCTEYAAGKYLIKYTGDVPEGSVAVYNGGAMLWSPAYEAWTSLSDTDVSGTISNADITTNTAGKEDVSYEGDVNGNGKVNIVDAQIAYDIASGVYNDFNVATMQMWMRSDVNKDALVSALDARAIQCIIHGIA
jgi:hypothetical protein